MQKPKRRFTQVKPLNPYGDFDLPKGHAALVNKRTQYPRSVKKPLPGMNVLISGEHSHKLGSHVVKGPWRGMPIFQLSLEERATCPTSCYRWRDCYGNAMGQARRWQHGPDLERAVDHQLAFLSGLHPKGFVVRLHVLGDFYSLEYVAFWRSMLEEFPGLRIFGYSARTGRIGNALYNLNRDFPGRCYIRSSDRYGGAGTAVVIDRVPNSGTVDEGIVCPAELGKTACCGTCGLCWSPAAWNKSIVFIRHGLDRNQLYQKVSEAHAKRRAERQAAIA